MTDTMGVDTAVLRADAARWDEIAAVFAQGLEILRNDCDVGLHHHAVVVAERSFDALAWAGEEIDGSPLKAICADGKHLHPTKATIRGDFHER